MILNLEDQVTSLEISKKLKELNVIQDTLYRYAYHENSANPSKLTLKLSDESYNENDIAAYTSAELGKLFPNEVKKIEEDGFFKYHSDLQIKIYFYNKYEVALVEDGGYNADCVEHIIKDANFANSLGLMLIYLLEELNQKE